ncbi:MAG TPA: OmpA family protein [Candidatus Aminicenantes bacterium]|nr:OmpA family protein [Candidatus Aminicenantes bacterium]
MKKTMVVAVFVLLAATQFLNGQVAQKIYNLQKAYVFLEEELLVNDTDLNCSYFIRDKVPQDIRIVGNHTMDSQVESFTNADELVIDSGAKDGLKEGDMLVILSEGNVIHHPRNHDRLGRFFFKKSLARITCLYDKQAVIRLQNGCQPVHVGDFALPYAPEATVFAKRADYKYCRIPDNAVSGQVVYTDLTMGIPSDMSGDQQYLTVDLGEGVVGKGSFLLFYRLVASDLPPLIVGLGVVIHSENTNSTVKVLDAGTDMRVGDRVLVLPREAAAAKPGQPGGEELPVVESLPGAEETAGEATVAGAALNYSILFPFDGVTPLADPSADFAAIRDFVAGKSEYVVTLRGYACSIGGEEYNLRLSSRRVEAIKGMLVSQYAIDPGRIETFFYGEKEPQFDNSTEAERRKNRLVKIEVNAQ